VGDWPFGCVCTYLHCYALLCMWCHI